MLDDIGVVIHWVGAAGAIGTATAAVIRIWREQPRTSGRTSGRGASLLTRRRYTVIVTIIYVAAMVLLWKPIPVPLSPTTRFTLDVLGAVILFPSLATYLWGMRTLGTMFGSSSAFGARLYTGHRLITSGPYRIIRHPMYAAVICSGIGGLLIYWTWATLFFAVNMFALTIRAKREERVLSEEFGEEWEEYKRRTPGWIPRLRAARGE